FLKDLVSAFGNRFLHHPDGANAYLASASQPATTLVDDAWGEFTVPADPRGFLDGGDANEVGLLQTTETPDDPVDVLLLADGSLESVFQEDGVEVGNRTRADLDQDGVFDVGDGIVLNLSEPFTDADQNGVFDVGEDFLDVGLDGVAD